MGFEDRDRVVREESRILIVDDTEDNIMLLEGVLDSSGYQNYQSTTDPREVMQMYMDYQPDLVLLDINMPYLNGFEVMQMLREVEHESYIPVIVLTAEIDPDVKIRALKEGARDFLMKPFDLIEVETRIRNQLEVRLLHNQVKNQNQVLEEKVRERTMELNETRLEVIRRLGLAAEYRDNETGNHIIRMSKISALIAREAGYNDTFADLILNASPMHDIGKIGIPDRVLLKPGKLDGEEWEIMKTHCEKGAAILSGHESDLMEMARNIAYCHHERWDGNGYPQGLAGENIPVEARITSVADVFDALTSVRPYKKAWPVEQALEEINNQKGKQFEARLVEALNNVLPDVRSIIARHTDRFSEES